MSQEVNSPCFWPRRFHRNCQLVDSLNGCNFWAASSCCQNHKKTIFQESKTRKNNRRFIDGFFGDLKTLFHQNPWSLCRGFRLHPHCASLRYCERSWHVRSERWIAWVTDHFGGDSRASCQRWCNSVSSVFFWGFEMACIRIARIVDPRFP